MTDPWPSVEASESQRIAEILRKKIEVARMLDVVQKHDERRDGKSDHPPFPVEDPCSHSS